LASTDSVTLPKQQVRQTSPTMGCHDHAIRAEGSGSFEDLRGRARVWRERFHRNLTGDGFGHVTQVLLRFGASVRLLALPVSPVQRPWSWRQHGAHQDEAAACRLG
jgi:hypothetical protein